MIALYLPELPMGGVERATVTLANRWAVEGKNITVLLDRLEGELIADLSADVTIEILGVSRTMRALPRLLSWLRRNRPATLHSSLPHNSIIALIAGLVTGTPVTIAEHSLLRDKIRLDRSVARIVPLMRLLYPRAQIVIAASQAVADDLRTILRIPADKLRVIGNPVLADGFDPSMLEMPSNMPADGLPIFIAVGRMAAIKDFATLLRAFRFVLDRRPAHLMILGDGPERSHLQILAAELDLGTQLTLHGVVQDPWPYIAHSSALVVSSVSEGFGITIVEAMACGTQVVSTRCGAPSDLLAEGALGALANIGDAEDLGNAMLNILEHPKPPAVLSAAAAAFTVSAISQRYYDALCIGNAA